MSQNEKKLEKSDQKTTKRKVNDKEMTLIKAVTTTSTPNVTKLVNICWNFNLTV